MPCANTSACARWDQAQRQRAQSRSAGIDDGIGNGSRNGHGARLAQAGGSRPGIIDEEHIDVLGRIADTVTASIARAQKLQVIAQYGKRRGACPHIKVMFDAIDVEARVYGVQGRLSSRS